MRILLVTNNKQLNKELDAEVYDHIGQIKTINSDDVLIINSYTDDEYHAGVELSNLIQQDLQYVLYLTDKPLLNMTSLVKSIGGLVDTEEYLLDTETLMVLIQNFKDTSKHKQQTLKYTNDIIAADAIETDLSDVDSGSQALINQSSIDVIKTFYHDYALGTIDTTNKAYLNIVLKAINDINDSGQSLTNYDKDVTNTVNELYSKASSELSQLENTRIQLTEELEHVTDKFHRITEQQGFLGLGNKIESFAPYKHINQHGTQVIVFKEYSQTRYLTSFILGYYQHIKTEMHKRLRVLFVLPNKQTIINKYEKSSEKIIHVTTNNYQSEEVVTNDLLYTEIPVSRMYQFLLDTHDDYFLVIDRTYNNEFCINGRVTKWHAFSGRSEADANPDIKENRIFSIRKLTQRDIVINHVENYPSANVDRRATYNKNFIEEYKKLDVINKITIK